MKKKLPLILCAIVMLAGCSRDSEKYADPRLRDAALLKEGLIYYGDDPQDDDFNDMYYAFAAGETEMETASALALDSFTTKVDNLSRRDRKYLYNVFTDLADLAEMANYAYKDAPVAIPEGWEDIGIHNPTVTEIFDMNLVSGFVAGGLKCSLMAKGERRVLVFAGTDFPSSWKSFDQVMVFSFCGSCKSFWRRTLFSLFLDTKLRRLKLTSNIEFVSGLYSAVWKLMG